MNINPKLSGDSVAGIDHKLYQFGETWPISSDYLGRLTSFKSLLLGFNELGEVRLYELVILPEWCLS